MPELSEHLDGFGWVNASGETGCSAANPRPFNLQWGRNIRDLCAEKGIPFYFSHIGGWNRYPSRLLDGVEHNQVPLLPEPAVKQLKVLELEEGGDLRQAAP